MVIAISLAVGQAVARLRHLLILGDIGLSQEEIHYERNPDFIYRKVVDEYILVPIHQDVADMDSIYTLNGVGAFVWEHLDQPKTQAELQSAMLEEYDAEPEVIIADLENFLGEMTSIGALNKV